MSNALIDAINKFLAWEKELVEVTSEQPRDGAERLGVVLYGKDDPVKLIGGCNAKIFHDAEAKISDLTERLAAAERERDEANSMASYEVAVAWRDKCWGSDERIAELEQRLAAAEAAIEQKDRVVGEYAFSERGLASQLTECRRLLREACGSCYDQCLYVDKDWYKAARAAGGVE